MSLTRYAKPTTRRTRARPLRLTDKAVNANSPRWSADGKSVYYLAKGGDAMQLWQSGVAAGSKPAQATALALDVNNYKLSPNGKSVLLSLDVFADCSNLACTKKHLDDKTANKASGTLYDKLFIRHWDTWADGRRSQLFIADFGADGQIAADSWYRRRRTIQTVR
jgi:dipeptidyl aminopeptidase/acylaminoacyl peptidase